MSKVFNVAILLLGLFLSCSRGPESGVELENFDKSIQPQDDFYRHVNGTWLDNTEIPADRSSYGTFVVLIDESEKNQRKIIEDAAQRSTNGASDEERKIGDFYKSFMDTAKIEALALHPVQDELARVAKVKTREELLQLMGYLQRFGVQGPIVFFVNQDLKDSQQYIGYLHQSGLGLPDRDYYFNEDDKFKDFRDKYVAYVEKILTLGEQSNPAEKARRIMEIETEIARHHWTRVENRDRDKTYNKYPLDRLVAFTPNFDWRVFNNGAGLNADTLIVRQPTYLEAFNKLFRRVSIENWQDYLTFKVLSDAAPYLSSEFVNARFDFYGRTLRGIEEIQPRWKRGVQLLDNALGEAVGKIYVSRHFKPEEKARMDELVGNLKQTFRSRIENLDWMGEETKKEALAKLARFNTKIGYPDHWRDYSALEVKKDDLLGNVKRANIFEFERNLAKLGQPVDRSEWFMTPQTVNAYYNPPMNEIVFPAAILQPPFFNMAADDAVNYGAIGAVIGHEIGHGFDDQGRKSDGEGNLRDWWTMADQAEFKKRADLLVQQFNKYNPIDTMHVNGRLTLGENIGDLGGLTVAYHAYQLSLEGKPAPVLDGFTGDQRFFIGWAQIWRRLYRDEELRRRLVTDPHSPSRYRCNGIVANMPEFYAAFDVKEGDQLHRDESKRVSIW